MIRSQVAEEIADYLPLLNVAQQEAVLQVVKAFAATSPDLNADETYAKVIERRFRELEFGADPGVSWEEVKRKGRELLAKR